MATRMDVNFWARDVKQTRSGYERWKANTPDTEASATSDYIAALECHNAALEEHVIKLRRKLRRARASKISA